jgi:virulence factor
MLSNFLIGKYRSLRKSSYLDRLSGYRHAYAFVGAGSHSIANLYPCIRQLNIPLRYICTKTITTATKMAATFLDCTPTTDLDTILKDPTVKGVFISTQPQLHPGLVSQALTAGKAVFVEKPPASATSQLQQLIALQGVIPCMTGLQRRFSTLHQQLQKHRLSSKPATYLYRYLTGPYPEGNPVHDLFIHPVDYALWLFGPAKDTDIHLATSGPLTTAWVHIEHTSGASGTLQLSTHHSWSALTETLEINTEKELLEAHYPFRLTGTEKPATIAGIPLEKLLRRPAIKKIYLDNQGTIPVAASNSLVSQGFWGEIEHFIQQVEDGKKTAAGSLDSLLGTYEILDKLNQTLTR